MDFIHRKLLLFPAHKFSTEACCEFNERKQDGSKIEKMLDKGHLKLIQQKPGVYDGGSAEPDLCVKANSGNFLKLLYYSYVYQKTTIKRDVLHCNTKILSCAEMCLFVSALQHNHHETIRFKLKQNQTVAFL